MSESEQQTVSAEGARRLRVYLDSGEIRIEPTADDVLACHLSALSENDEDAVERVMASRVGSRGDEVYVEAPRRKSFFGRNGGLLLLVLLPEGCDLDLEVGSADIRCTATPGDVRVVSGSGDVAFGRVLGTASIETGSGDVLADAVTGDLRVKAGSGDVEVRSASQRTSITTGSGGIRIDDAGGPTQVKVGSGDVVVQRAESDFKAATASGSLRLERAEGGRVIAETASGDLSVGVPGGVRAWLDVHTMSGEIDSQLKYSSAPAQDEPRLEIRARTISGDVHLLRV